MVIFVILLILDSLIINSGGNLFLIADFIPLLVFLIRSNSRDNRTIVVTFIIILFLNSIYASDILFLPVYLIVVYLLFNFFVSISGVNMYYMSLILFIVIFGALLFKLLFFSVFYSVNVFVAVLPIFLNLLLNIIIILGVKKRARQINY